MALPHKHFLDNTDPRPLRGFAAAARTAGPAAQFAVMAGVGGFGAWAMILALTGASGPIALGFYALAALVAFVGLRRGYPHPVIGWCNTVTLFRLMLVSVLMALLLSPAGTIWPVIGLAVLAFALDGLDGWLARREGYASRFGASFDVEVDSVLALLLALHVWLAGDLGAYVILMGLPRYIFAVAQVPLPWLDGDLPPRFSRKAVCVLQIAVLIVLLLPGLGAMGSHLLLGAAALALLWSFALDIRGLWKARQ